MSLWAPAGGGTHIVLNPIRQLMSRWEGVQNLCLSRQHFQKKKRVHQKQGQQPTNERRLHFKVPENRLKLPQKSENQWITGFSRSNVTPEVAVTSIKSPSPTGRALQGRSSHKDNVSLQIEPPGDMYCRNFSEMFRTHAFSFWILSLPRRLEISNFEGSEIVSDLHSASPLLVEMRSSADAATTAKLHHRSPCKGEKTKKWIRNIETHVGLRIPYFSTKARHSKQNIFINLKKKSWTIRGHMTETHDWHSQVFLAHIGQHQHSRTRFRNTDHTLLDRHLGFLASFQGAFGGGYSKKITAFLYGEDGENKTETQPLHWKFTWNWSISHFSLSLPCFTTTDSSTLFPPRQLHWLHCNRDPASSNRGHQMISVL